MDLTLSSPILDFESIDVWRLSLAFLDIALHRRGPEDLPASQFLFGLSLCAYLAVGVLVVQISEPWGRSVGLVGLEAVLYLGFVWLLLGTFGHAERFMQTASALLGVETILNLMAMPLVLWVETTADVDSAAQSISRLLFSLLILWGIDIAGFVLSRSLQLTYVVGVLIVIGYLFGSIALRGLIFPPAA